MNIDRNNYEVFFLDYIEGRLSPEMVEELQIFLALNPDLDEELRGIDQSVLSYNEEIFDQKDSLKKPEFPIAQEELDDMLMLEFDGLANAEVLSKLDQLSAQYEAVSRQRKAMQKARWTADTENFEFKSLLRMDATPDMQQTDMLLAGATEGDLSQEEQTELNRRMESDASLAASLEQMKSAHVAADQTSFEKKTEVSIPESIDYSDIRNLMIAKVEGDLTREQNERLSAALAADSQLRDELQRFYQARLMPEAIVFEGKNDLRQKETRIIPMRRILSIATSIAAVLVLVFWIGSNKPDPIGEVAGTHDPDTKWNNTPEKVVPPSNDSDKTNSDIEVNAPEVIKENHIAPDELAYDHKPQIDSKENDGDDLQPRKAAPIQSLKTLHAPENAFAFTQRKDRANPALDMSLIHDTENTAEVVQPQENNTTAEPATIWQLLSEVAGDRLEKTAAFALVERQVEKVSPQERDKFKLERVDRDEKSQIRMKLGKFEVSRDTKKRSTSKGRLERIIDRFVKE
ncbi:MAG: hypothetical protein ACKVOK_08935 [Flavobacteriales bacterium]